VRGVWGPGRNIYSRRRTTAGQGLDRTATVRRFKRVAGSNGRRFHFFEFHHGERTELPPGGRYFGLGGQLTVGVADRPAFGLVF
jgi:hypothetical protein